MSQCLQDPTVAILVLLDPWAPETIGLGWTFPLIMFRTTALKMALELKMALQCMYCIKVNTYFCMHTSKI